MGILEGETDLHCNGAGEHWSRRPSGIARVSQRETDLCCNGAGERWSRRLSCIAMGDGNTGRGDQLALQWGGRALEQETEWHCKSVAAGDRLALQWGMGVLEGETDLHCSGTGER